MTTYVWRNLFQRKIRTGLSMLGVSVSVAGIVALLSVTQGMRGSVDDYMEASGAALIVFSGQAADLIFSTVTQAEIDRIGALDGVEGVARVNFFVVRPPKTGDRDPALPALFCFGRYPEERLLSKYGDFLVEGRLFEARAELLASRFVAQTLGWGVGTRIPLFGETFEVVGIFDSDIAWENGGVILHADVLAQQLGRKDNYTLVFVYAAEARRDAVRARIETAFPDFKVIRPGEFTRAFADQLEILDDFIGIITVIALVVGILGVLNTMMMSVSERTREIGTLRALGWSKRRVLATVLCEGVLLSCVGGAFGLGLGVAGTEALLGLWTDAYLVARYQPTTFVYGALVALVVGVLAASYPALRAARLRPVEALRYE